MDYEFLPYNNTVCVYSNKEDRDIGYIMNYRDHDPLFKIEVTLSQHRIEQLISEFNIWKSTHV